MFWVVIQVKHKNPTWTWTQHGSASPHLHPRVTWRYCFAFSWSFDKSCWIYLTGRKINIDGSEPGATGFLPPGVWRKLLGHQRHRGPVKPGGIQNLGCFRTNQDGAAGPGTSPSSHALVGLWFDHQSSRFRANFGSFTEPNKCDSRRMRTSHTEWKSCETTAYEEGQTAPAFGYSSPSKVWVEKWKCVS